VNDQITSLIERRARGFEQVWVLTRQARENPATRVKMRSRKC